MQKYFFQGRPDPFVTGKDNLLGHHQRQDCHLRLFRIGDGHTHLVILSSHPRWQVLTKLYPGRRARSAGADVLVVSSKLLKFGFLSTTRKLGLPVWVYTVNDRKELWEMITEGKVAGIFSDRPDVALFLRDLYAVSQDAGRTTQNTVRS